MQRWVNVFIARSTTVNFLNYRLLWSILQDQEWRLKVTVLTIYLVD